MGNHSPSFMYECFVQFNRVHKEIPSVLILYISHLTENIYG